MKIWLSLLALLTWFGASISYAQQPYADQLPKEARYDQRVTMNLPAGIDLKTYIKELAGTIGLQPILENVPELPINRPLNDVKFRDAWNVTMALGNFQFELLEKNVVVVSSPEIITRLRALNANPATLPSSASSAAVNLNFQAGKNLEDVVRAIVAIAKLQMIPVNIPSRTVDYNLKGLSLKVAWNVVLALGELDYYIVSNDIVTVGAASAIDLLRPKPVEVKPEPVVVVPPPVAVRPEIEVFVETQKVLFVGFVTSTAVRKAVFQTAQGIKVVEIGAEIFKDSKVTLKSFTETEAILSLGDQSITLKIQKP
jgi:hypothetical protein